MYKFRCCRHLFLEPPPLKLLSRSFSTLSSKFSGVLLLELCDSEIKPLFSVSLMRHTLPFLRLLDRALIASNSGTPFQRGTYLVFWKLVMIVSYRVPFLPFSSWHFKVSFLRFIPNSFIRLLPSCFGEVKPMFCVQFFTCRLDVLLRQF